VIGAKLSRRQWLQQISAIGMVLPLGWSGSSPLYAGERDTERQPQSPDPPPAPNLPPALFKSDPTKYRFTAEQDSFLEEVERVSFRYFWEQAHPDTGLVKDRARASGPDSRNIASIAATGFGLTSLCIADHREWQDRKEIRDRVRSTLRFAESRLPQAHGFFSHFLNLQNGQRVLQSEVSSIDSAIFLCGALTCRAYFDDAEIYDLVGKICARVDWRWLLHGDKTPVMAWTPEHGFVRARWDSYSELMMIYLLGLGWPSKGMSKAQWESWARPSFEFNGIRYIGSHAPLFVHQYSHAWFDFRGRQDKYADYFINSVIATKVHKLWCQELAREFPDYSENLWGITASDSARGYAIWGGPPPMGRLDGTIVPCAAGGSLPFLPEEAVRVLETIREQHEQRAWQRYGFVDAFNPLTNWYSQDVIGIDLGITLVMAENARTGFVWEQFMKNEVAEAGMARAGFHPIGAGETATSANPATPSGSPLRSVR